MLYTYRVALGEMLSAHLKSRRLLGPVELASSQEEALALAKRRKGAVVILDVSHPTEDMFALARRLARPPLERRVILFLDTVAEGWISRGLEVGASGFVGSASALSDFERAIRAARKGQRFVGPGVGRVLSEMASSGSRVPRFSARELSVLEGVCEGLSTKEISRKLGLQPKAIDEVRLRLMAKTRTARATALVRYACAERIVDLQPRWEKTFLEETEKER